MQKQLRSSRADSRIASVGGVKQFILAYRADENGHIARGWKPKRGFTYAVVRAISARVNQNFDAWPSEELKKTAHLWLGKPVFVNHQNEDPSLARGKVIAARYIESGDDKYIETIMEVDAKRFPKLARELREGGLDSVSMGVEAGFTICSVCENRATEIFDMCSHIKLHKGEYLRNKKTGKKTLVFESCHKLSWFELSFVFDPADETALVSRVISASNKQAGVGDAELWPEGSSYIHMPDHHSLHVFPPFQGTPAIPGAAPAGKGNPNYEWVHTQHGEPINGGMAPTREQAQQHAKSSYDAERAAQDMIPTDWDPDRDHADPRYASWYVRAFGECEAPEDIDTLRDESEDDTDDFHHWIESPKELRAPDMDKAKRLDRDQEEDGLDNDRRAEDAEEFGAPGEPQEEPQYADEEQRDPNDPPMPINVPAPRKGRRNLYRGASMSRSYRYAADEDEDYGDDTGSQDDGGSDVDSLVDEAEQDLEDYENEGSEEDSGDDEGYDDPEGEDADEDGVDDSEEEAEPEEEEGDDSEDDDGEDEEASGDQPPWLQKDSYHRPVRSAASSRNRRGTQGGSMTGSTLAQRARVAARGRQHLADDGYTDGGPYGVDDSQGLQEDVFISEVPSAEAVCAPADDASNISNTPNNLVAYKQPQFDPNHYQRLADVVSALPPAQRRAMADKMVRMLTADNTRFNWQTFFQAAKVPVVKKGNRYFYAEDLTDPDKVDPGLSGTDVQDLKGDDFESLALDDVETQPKDASIHAFAAFDQWLQQATGRTARQHGNANYIRRAAASYVQRTGRSLEGLFPTLEYVLREAKKVERGANMRRRAEDVSLETAAPDGRVDVEAPVKNVTDAEAQASQFDLGDFANNASDNLADPVLDVVDGNAGTWAPDKAKESSRKLASGVEAVRCADAYIHAYPNTYSEGDRWQLTARFETLRQNVVRERIRLLEAVVEDSDKAPKKTARKVAAASSRGTKGIPPGFASQRTSGVSKVAASDPDSDSMLFFN